MASTRVRPCSVADALELLGERWSLLVLRELVLGNPRFSGIAAATGAPRDVLTSRLRSLEHSGLVARRRYSDRPVRHEYVLTDEGRRSTDVLLALMAFGDGLRRGEPPVRWHHGDHVLEPVMACRRCGRPAGEDLHDPEGPGAVFPAS